MLIGCAQDLIFSDINRDTVEVLARNGCEVVTPPKQLCCGSLHAHNGEWELAQQLARKQLEQFPPDQFDAIITNAGGCGSHLKHYHKLLADDPAYRDRAALWDKKVKDIHEWLVEIGIQPPANHAPAQVVTYHESCHLAHGQKITAQPRQLLGLIPNLQAGRVAGEPVVLRQRRHLQHRAAGNGQPASGPQAQAHQVNRRQHRGQRQPGLPAPAHQRREAAGLEAARRPPGNAAGRSVSPERLNRNAEHPL